MKTKIEWADVVWNPVTGCTKVSAGCKNCYAEQIAGRFWGERKFTDVRCHEERLNAPLHWRKPRRVFVNSMSDLFHPDVPFEFIFRIFSVMALAKQHTFMILTKRPKRMLAWFKHYSNGGFSTPETVKGRANLLLGKHPADHIEGWRWPLPNVWLGVSVENQAAADERIPYLLQTPAAVRFVSCEPLLGPVDLGIGVCQECGGCGETAGHYGQSDGMDTCRACGGSGRAYEQIDWVIAGGESGPNARPMHPDWVRDLRDQCTAAGVPYFLKQMPVDGQLVKMPELDGRVWAEYPGGENENHPRNQL